MTLNYNTELPGYVRNVLPYRVQTKFREVFNGGLAKGFGEAKARRLAWAEVRKEASNIQGDIHLPSFMGRKKKKVEKKLSSDATKEEYIDDFVNSDDKRFDGKSKKERIRMALGAFYNKAAPRTLYVCRYVQNGADIIKWAKAQGFKQTMKPEDLHVTIAHSRYPVDWMKADPTWSGDTDGNITIAPGGPRLVEPLGDKGAVVLMFKDYSLQRRWEEFKNIGAQWDYDGYQPHITITWDKGDLDLSKVEPYSGKIVLGPEVFSEVDDNWVDNLVEKSFRSISWEDYSKLVKKGAELDDARVVKVDKSLGLVFGWAIICKAKGKDYYDLNVDHNGNRVPEHIPEHSMLKAASDFMENHRVAKEMHDGDQQGSVVFAFPLTTDIAKAMGIQTDTTGLLIAMKPSKEMLVKFASGELTGFSIGGSRVKSREYEETT